MDIKNLNKKEIEKIIQEIKKENSFLVFLFWISSFFGSAYVYVLLYIILFIIFSFFPKNYDLTIILFRMAIWIGIVITILIFLSRWIKFYILSKMFNLFFKKIGLLSEYWVNNNEKKNFFTFKFNDINISGWQEWKKWFLSFKDFNYFQHIIIPLKLNNLNNMEHIFKKDPPWFYNFNNQNIIILAIIVHILPFVLFFIIIVLASLVNRWADLWSIFFLFIFIIGILSNFFGDNNKKSNLSKSKEKRVSYGNSSKEKLLFLDFLRKFKLNLLLKWDIYLIDIKINKDKIKITYPIVYQFLNNHYLPDIYLENFAMFLKGLVRGYENANKEKFLCNKN